jgi:GT2 family glycosyltransferase
MICDLGVVQADGQVFPLLFPSFDLERLLEQGYATLCFALPDTALPVIAQATSLSDLLLGSVLPPGSPMPRAAILHIPHPGGTVAEQDLMATCSARTSALIAAVTARIGQSPGLPAGCTVTALAHCDVPSFPSLRLNRPLSDRAVSVIIPTRNQGQMLATAVNSLKERNPGFDFDIVIVDNGSTEGDTLNILDRLEQHGARVLEFGEGFNFSLINNLACEHARHAQLCFMNNDVAFPDPGVLAELCGRLVDPQVGAAGPLMTRASDIIQHGGVVLGTWHGAVHAFEDRMFGDPGYGDLLRVASEPSAVTGAFVLTRRALFEDLGGFDEHLFSVNFNDVDYCLRLGVAGYRIVFSPHVRIQHLESVSRGRETQTPAGLRMQREVANLRARWREVLLNDPQFHPLFAIDSLPYRALAISHRAPAARRAGARPPSALPGWI